MLRHDSGHAAIRIRVPVNLPSAMLDLFGGWLPVSTVDLLRNKKTGSL